MSREVSSGFYLLLGIGLVFGNVSVYRQIFAPPVLTVTILDVGKGDAVLVRSPDDRLFLIDTGPDASILRALGSALSLWRRHINAAVLTSARKSSVGGLSDVTSRYQVTQVIRSGTRGERLVLGGGVYADILWPPQTNSPMNSANNILVLRISYGTTSFLIQNNLPPRSAAWLTTADAHLPPPDLTISSSTPIGVYISDGKSVTKTK